MILIITLVMLVVVSIFVIWRRNFIVKSYTKLDISGKIVVITGANSGIGKETARELAKSGARVIMACRSLEKAEAALNDIRKSVPDANIVVKGIDLALMESVKKFADEVIAEEGHVDVLINNAGVLFLPILLANDGLEYTFATNYLGHFLLSQLLLPAIMKSDLRRIILVSSKMYTYGNVQFDSIGEMVHTDGLQQYSNTKLMVCLFGRELHRRINPKGVSVFTIHPGTIATNMDRHIFSEGIAKFLKDWLSFFVFKTPKQGCQTTVFCATASGLHKFSGAYFKNCNMLPWHPKALQDTIATQLWQYSYSKVETFITSD